MIIATLLQHIATAQLSTTSRRPAVLQELNATEGMQTESLTRSLRETE